LVARKSNCVHAEFCIGFGAETIAKANTVIPICIVLWVTSKIRRRVLAIEATFFGATGAICVIGACLRARLPSVAHFCPGCGAELGEVN
jgi:hypothetical protein